MSNSKQLDELLERAQAPDDGLRPLIMTEGESHAPEGEQGSNGSDSNGNNDDADEEELDNKSARRKLLESFTDDEGEKADFNLSYVLRGDILTAHWLRQQIWWLIMVVALAFVYVSNRYYAQKQQIHNNHLKEQLKEIHYDAMARSSQLMRHCRRSTIVEIIESNPQNTLQMPDKQPATIPSE